MIPAELLKKVRRIQIRSSHMANDVFVGQYHSAFKGRGMEFEEVRLYQIGDDVRTIDWNVSARYGEPYVKVFREERELTVMLLVDLSASHLFGTHEQRKRDLVTEICATLSFSAIQNNDKVGLICFTDRVEKFVPPKKGLRHVLRVIRELLYHPVEGKGTDIEIALEHLNRVTTRRAVVFLVSDFQTSGYEDALRVAKRRHDVIPIVVADARELQTPDVGLVEFLDSETGRRMVVDTSSRRLRRDYSAEASRARDRLDQLFRRSNLDAVRLMTGESFAEPLTKFFKKRMARL